MECRQRSSGGLNQVRGIDDRSLAERLPQPLLTLITLERQYMHRAEQFLDPALDPSFDARYLPQYCGGFELPCFWIPRRHLQLYSCQNLTDADLGIYSACGSSEQIVLPIHPLSLPLYADFLARARARHTAEDGLKFQAIPTSSVRTLLAWPDDSPNDAALVKTTLPISRIFGDRRVHRTKTASCVGLTSLVQSSAKLLPHTFGYMPELMGFSPRAQPDSGVIIRGIPHPLRSGQIVAAPLFSLSGGTSGHEPLLLQIKSIWGISPFDLIEELLCKEFSRLWLTLSTQLGLLPEFHGQNLMLCLSPSLKPLGGFMYRDFDGMLVDWPLRSARGLHTPDDLPRSWAWHETYATVLANDGYGELAWWKMRISLYAYFRFVLDTLTEHCIEWQRSGLLPGPEVNPGHFTKIASHYFFKQIFSLFGVRTAKEYDIYHSLNRFLLLLMDVRGAILAGRAA